ncbi:MAG: hypothetical protein ACR2PO_04460 [Methyloligellaceae bacterium]
MSDAKTDLETFLKELPSEAAGKARAAAGRIDELGRVSAGTQGIERKYAPWFLISVILFICAAFAIFSGGDIFRQARAAVGVMGLTALSAALPLIGILYCVQVRHRTRADHEMLELNKVHFLPYGGIYFPPGEEGPGGVIRTEPIDADEQAKRRQDPVRPRRFW